MNNIVCQAVLFLVLLALVNSEVEGGVNSMNFFHAPKDYTDAKSRFVMGEHMALTNRMVPIDEREADFWKDLGRSELNSRVASQNLNKNKAKNVIMFLGDGMSLSTITAARIAKGQRQSATGEETVLAFEKFPHTGLSKTYCTNAQVPDSACTATAYLCGVKANTLTIGVTANVEYGDCASAMDEANQVSSIAAWAQAAGKSTGFVTTTSLTHASPSGSYAHTASRLFESDADITTYSQGTIDPKTCTDIAQQLVTKEPGKNFDVMMGGGMGKFLPNTIKDFHGKKGERKDGKNLLSKWQSLHPKGSIVKNRKQLLGLNVKKVSNVMGLFQSQLMDYHLDASSTQPTLAEMTEVTLKMLQKNENGFFVFIEGGLIDFGNHANKAGYSTDELLEMEKAIEVALNMTDSSETLIVITADHAHPLSISGYPERGSPILGLNNMGADLYGVPYSTLNYAVGTNQYLDGSGKRVDLTDEVGSLDFVFPSYIESDIGVHAGDDVGVFANGPYSHLFTGVLQQSTIPRLMAYAACIGDGPTACD